MAAASLLEGRGIGRRAPGPDDGDRPWLLRGVSITVGRGEAVAVVGPTGAGKSLLLRALALLDPVDEGDVLWDGRPVEDDEVPAFRRRIVYLHQRPALLDGTVERNLRTPFGFASGGDQDYDPDRVVAMLAELGRGAAFLARSTEDLSGGEAQLVALVRAIQLEPDGLLLDEPTAALDPEATAALERLVAGWRGAGPERSVVWVSHDAAQAERVADRTIRLADGGVAP